MNLPNAVRVRYEDLRSLDWTLITANYVAVGLPFNNPVCLIKLANDTDVNLLVSLNGLTDIDIAPANSYAVIDYNSNKSNLGGYLEVAAGEIIYVKAESGLPTGGKFYLTAIYASQV